MPMPMPEIAAADLAACRAMLAGGSRSFHAAALLLPRRVAEPAAALYAFCRVADDAIDREGGDAATVAALERRLDAMCAGRPEAHAPDRAFAAVIARFGIPRTLPAALIEGLRWDAEGRRYETLAELEAYAARVAGTVGAMMALVMGVRSPEAIARAADLGVAMQLTNIARDVGEDARAGRIYLPLDWLREAAIAPGTWLTAPHPSPSLGAVVARLLAAAERHYVRAEAGVALLPRDCRPGIAAARLIYAEIGRVIAARGWDSVTRRAVVPGRRKAALLLRALGAGLHAPLAAPAAPLAANRFLVDSVRLMATTAWPGAPRWWELGERIVRVAEIFARLDARDRARHGSPASGRGLAASGSPGRA